MKTVTGVTGELITTFFPLPSASTPPTVEVNFLKTLLEKYIQQDLSFTNTLPAGLLEYLLADAGYRIMSRKGATYVNIPIEFIYKLYSTVYPTLDNSVLDLLDEDTCILNEIATAKRTLLEGSSSQLIFDRGNFKIVFQYQGLPYSIGYESAVIDIKSFRAGVNLMQCAITSLGKSLPILIPNASNPEMYTMWVRKQ